MENAVRQLDIAERLGDDTAMFQGLLVTGVHWTVVGRPRAAVTLMRQAIDFARRTGRPALIVHGLINLAAMSSSQDLDLALTTSEEAVALSPRASATYRSFAYINRVIALYVAGDWSEMRRMLVEMQAAPLLSAPDVHRALSDWVSYASHEGFDDAGDRPRVRPRPRGLDQPWISQSQINAARAAGDRAALAQASADGLDAAVEAMGTGDDFSVLWPHFVAGIARRRRTRAGGGAGRVRRGDRRADSCPRCSRPSSTASGACWPSPAARIPKTRYARASPHLTPSAHGLTPPGLGTRSPSGSSRRAATDEADELLTSARAVYEEIGAARWLAELPERSARLAADPG